MTLSLTQFLQDDTPKLQYDIINVKETLDEAFKIINHHILSKKIRLIQDINTHVPKQISTDKQKLLFILQIFLENALKYTNSGYIIIGIKKQKEQNNKNDEFNYYQIWVKDSGIGISQKKQQKLFQQLFDQQEINIEKPQGSGMRLFVAQKIAQLLGGQSIKIKSEVKKFSKFSFYIKSKSIKKITQEQMIRQSKINKKIKEQVEDKQLRIHSSQFLEVQNTLRVSSLDSLENNLIKVKSYQSECNCEKILIVDDSEIIRMILSEILEMNGYSFQKAENGKEALDIVKKRMKNKCCKRFLVILMDCEMPVLDGWQATQKIREQGYKATIIGHTAYAHEQDVKRCMRAGMNNVLFKPSPSEVILQEIKKYDIE